MHLSEGEKLILMMLSEIHGALNIKDGIAHATVKEAIHSGNYWALRTAFPGVFSERSGEGVKSEVVDILDMYRFLEESGREDARFHGFDGNHEGEHASVMDIMTEHLGMFESFKGRARGGIYTVPRARRQLAVFGTIRPTLAGRKMTDAEIDAVLNA